MTGVVPARVDAAADDAADKARHALAEDGAVVLTGLPVTADGLVLAAATVHGADLRELFPVRERASRDGGAVHLHADSFDQVVDVGGVPVRRRDPDEDAVLVQCVRGPASGGESFVADAYRFVEDADPELVAFLTGDDVDLYGAWTGLRGLPAIPRVARHVEYTRTGRRIVRRGEGAVPLHRDPAADRITAMLARFTEATLALEATLPRFALAEGDVLVLDNYRCWHGRDAHTGERVVRILTLRTAAAR
ncbi:TauD/TfdA family dioxygenase [Actinophytocola gossypii]|uniref:TauD/TfdA family dioxygenase n=1 Tax=Actinophytocola gossypii TaxID=2812003 RepID=A0ABT2J9J3_9PSEU|nr:TauD/TfdA family dioxygenase [Actinophytocola gossypii]MCT2584381.1 TauD/TfdA family dioxygenase [Actinophytocola gossypii]